VSAAIPDGAHRDGLRGADRRLLLVHAHPDDETISTATTMAGCVADGGRVTLITCTLGEVGEILVPELAELSVAAGDQLGGYRMGELAAAMSALGVVDHRYLGRPGRWRDSGMMGTPENDHPRAFWRCAYEPAAFAEAVGQVVAVIREVRPQVLITYDPDGGYGHPDHIMAHRVAMAAAEHASRSDGSDRPWAIEKIYWTALPHSVIQLGIDAVRADAATTFQSVERVEDLPFGNPDDEVTTAVDAPEFLDAKLAALRAHATQVSVDRTFFALSNNIGSPVRSIEYYRIAKGDLGSERDTDGRETDLFAGITGLGG
jgi:N-acetyl-1-D-myo-inositol-2-amino-2-deoxy-alpha-D-glucopyranoside deacetylase